MLNYPSSSDSRNNFVLGSDKEISLLDIVCFLKKTWRVMLAMGALGLLVSIVYLLVTPARHEAIANIQMARIPSSSNPLGINVEEPAALIARMSLPTSLNEATLKACQLQDISGLSSQLGKAIKLSLPKGGGSVVELKVIRSSPDQAKACANAVFEAIAQAQSQKIEESSKSTKEKMRSRLAKIEERLTQDKSLLTRAEQTKGAASAISPVYFELLSEIRTLEDERERLQDALESPALRAAQLQSPIYTADNPVYPKKGIALAAGLFGGLFLGLLLSLGRKMIANVRAQLLSLGADK